MTASLEITTPRTVARFNELVASLVEGYDVDQLKDLYRIAQPGWAASEGEQREGYDFYLEAIVEAGKRVKAASEQPKPEPVYTEVAEALLEKAARTESRKAHGSIPDGRYAVAASTGQVKFYEVRQGGPSKSGRGRDWTGYTFIDLLVGAPGDFNSYKIQSKAERTELLNAIAADVAAASTLFGQKTNHCGFCPSPLTDPRSRYAGRGEKCSENHGLYYPTLAEALAGLGEEA